MRVISFAVLLSLVSPTAFAQQTDPLAESTIYQGAQTAYGARTNRQSASQVIGSCLSTVQQLRARQRTNNNLPFCAAYDTAIALIAGHEHRPDAAAIGQQTTERVHTYLVTMGVPSPQIPSMTNQIAHLVAAKLEQLDIIAAAPTDTYREVQGTAVATVAHLPDGSLHLHLSTSGNGCGGDAEGPAVQSGKTIIMSKTDSTTGPDDACHLTLTRFGGARMSVLEQSCSAWHGMSCEFAGSYKQVQ